MFYITRNASFNNWVWTALSVTAVFVGVLSSCSIQSGNGGGEPSTKGKPAEYTSPIGGKPKNGWNSGYLDRAGRLWLGSNGGGLYRWDGRQMKHFTVDQGLCCNQVYSITEDLSANLWVGTQEGLCKYDGEKFISVALPYQDTTGAFWEKVYPVLNPNAVHALALDHDGNIWIGTGGGGAYCYDGREFFPLLTQIGRKQEDSLYHNWIPDIEGDKEGRIWLASMTHGGVSCYDGATFVHYMTEQGLSDDMVRVIYEDRNGRIWLGFNGNRRSGLTYFDGHSFGTYSTADGLCNSNIQAIYMDAKGGLWLGSGRGELCVFDGNAFVPFADEHGRTFEQILFLVEDAEGYIWFGGPGGLWRCDGNRVTDMVN